MPTSVPSSADRRGAMNANLAANWWIVALRGAFGILFGLVAIAAPGVTIATLVVFFSAYMLADGFVAIGAAVRAAQKHERWGLLVLEGFVNVLAGVAAFLWPALTAILFVYLVAAWSILSGSLMMAAAFGLEGAHGRVWLVLGGLVSVAFGVALLVWPVAGAVVLATWLGVYALVFGAVLLGLAFRLRGRHRAA